MSTKAKSGSSSIVELVKTVVYALLIAAVFRTLLFQPFWIPSGSMKPTLLIGDFLFVNKFAYGYSRNSCPFSACPFSGRIWASEPERGDVIVFRHPRTGEDYVKRLIGLPGDRVQVKESQLYINGAAVETQVAPDFVEPYVAQGLQTHPGSRPNCINGPVAQGADCVKRAFTETLPGGVTHEILDVTETRGDNTVEFTVPPGEYFFMGDNRDNSIDSRFSQSEGGVGFVPFENLIGRADRIIFSSAGDSLLAFWDWRADRFFKAVE
ncbi:signal peptidase I [Oceanicella sp. SM1341]|uniref:signal peptidase I n=1 Tax=Oceanicella sp. SM1341 TaxID=1548889 RepID=UPI000E4D67AF|nr:signal peptidase I [Oceanicella sp. SM1341]